MKKKNISNISHSGRCNSSSKFKSKKQYFFTAKPSDSILLARGACGKVGYGACNFALAFSFLSCFPHGTRATSLLQVLVGYALEVLLFTCSPPGQKEISLSLPLSLQSHSPRKAAQAKQKKREQLIAFEASLSEVRSIATF